MRFPKKSGKISQLPKNKISRRVLLFFFLLFNSKMSFQNKPYSTSSKQPLRTTPSTHTRSSPSSSHHQFSSQSNQNNQQQNNNGINLTSDQISEIKESFNLFDMDKDGKLNYHELKVAMKALGFELKKFEVIQILKDANSSSNSKGGGGNGGGEGSVGGMMIDEERFMEVSELFFLYPLLSSKYLLKERS